MSNTERATNRAALFVARFGQFTVAFCYLIGAITANSTKGWWLTIQPAFTLGMISSGLSLFFFLPFFYFTWMKPLTPRIRMGGSITHMYFDFFLAIVRDFVLCSLWLATFVTMTLPKGKDFKHLFDHPPYATWMFSIVCAAVQIIAYAWTTFHLFNMYTAGMPNRVPIETV